MHEMILCKLGEVVLKGLNRRSFEDKLMANVNRRVAKCGNFRIYAKQSTIYVEPKDENCDIDAAFEGCKKVFGIIAVSKALPCEKDVQKIIAAAKEKGIEIVPLLNLPGHANAILDIADDTYNASGSNNTLNVASSEKARNFGMAIFKKYVDYFSGKGCKFFNFGADEYANDASGTFSFSRLNSTQYATFVSFINSLAEYIENKGMTARI